MKRILGWAYLAVPALLVLTPASAQQDPRTEAALAQIKETTDDICLTVQQRGRKSEAQLTGEIEAKLPTVVAKVVAIGAKGTGQISRSEYEGLSQETVGAALQSSIDCRQHVSIKLIERLLPSASAVGPAPDYSQRKAYNQPQVYTPPNAPPDPDPQDIYAMIAAGKNADDCFQRLDRTACREFYRYSSQQCSKGDQKSCEAANLLTATGLK
jgi:hypothetical protein